MRALRFAVVVVSFALLAVPGVATALGVALGEPLAGVVVPPEVPRPTLTSFGDETLQRALTKWFDAKLAIRSPLVRLDNSATLHVFGETRHGKHVIAGKDGVLFLDDQVGGYNRSDALDGARFAAKVKRLQELLAARGKAMIFIVIPNKARLFARELPDAWILDVPSPHPAEARVFEPMARALDEQHVAWVDGVRALATLPREHVYTKTGRHLTAYAICLLLREGFDQARVTLPSLPPIDCAHDLRTDVPVTEDQYDLFRLLDVLDPPPTLSIPVTRPVPPHGGEAPPTMVVGTSFGWRILYEGKRNHAFGRTHYFYYDITLVDYDGDGLGHRTPPLTPEWREAMLSKSLFVLDLPEEFVPVSIQPFVEALTQALEN